MKLLIQFTIIFFPILSFAQDIQIASDQVDDFTGVHLVMTKPYNGKRWKIDDFIDDKNSLLLHVSYTKTKDEELGSFAISLTIFPKYDIGCLSEHDGRIILLMVDGTTMELKQMSKTDCSNSVMFGQYWPLSETEMRDPLWHDILLENCVRMAVNDIKKLRLYASEGHIDFDIATNKQDIIGRHISEIKRCLTKP